MTAEFGRLCLDEAGIVTSRVALGTMTFGSQVGPEEAARMVRRCLVAGITMFDTAGTYNDGRSETILGRAVAGRRDEVLLCTKVGGGTSGAGALAEDAVVSTLEASLRRLGTDYVDVYYLHRPDRSTPAAQTIAALGRVLRSGQARAWGVSNFSAWRLMEMVMTADQLGVPRPVLSQPVYNLLLRRIEPDYTELTRHLGVANIVYNPLAGGLLTGKHRAGELSAPTGRFEKQSYRDRYWSRGHFRAVDQLAAIADAAGMAIADMSLRWVLQRPDVDAVLVGASNLAQLEMNLCALALSPLDDTVMAECDRVWASLHGDAPEYSR